MRIRKRSAASFSGKPELHESNNGGLHLQAISKSNPSSHYAPTSSLIPHAGSIKQDHLLLTGSSYVALHRSSQKEVPVEAVSLKRKPCTDWSAGVEFSHDDKAVMMPKEDKNPSAKTAVDLRHNEVEHMHTHDDDDGYTTAMLCMRGCKEVGLLGLRGEEKKLSEESKKAKYGAAFKGSATVKEVYVHTDLVDAAECPRKVRPLQLILSSDHSSTAPKFPLPLCPISSSNTNMPCTPPPLPRKFDKNSSSAVVRTPPLTSSAGGSSVKQIAEVKSRGLARLLRNDDSSSSCGSEQSLTNVVRNQAELKSCQRLFPGDVSSWQGHRRRRTHVQGGRKRPGFTGLSASSVNAVSTKDSTHKDDPSKQVTRKKAKQNIKRKPLDTLVSLQLGGPPSLAPGSAELKEQEDLAAINKAYTKKDPLFLFTSAACDIQGTNMIRSILAEGSLDSKPASATARHANDEQVVSILPAATSDQVLQHDSMRCRRKDGRRWQCKAQVIKAGAPFCHYHTLKMREKRAASAARKLSKQVQGEVRISMSHTDFTCRTSSKRAKKMRRVGSPPSIKAAHESCKVAAVDNEDESKEEPEDVEEEDETEGEQKKGYAELAEKQKMYADQVAEKQQIQEISNMALKRRWRKKCKPCIRRLHDIHDRARPAGMDVLDVVNPWEEDTSYPKKDSPPVRVCSPLPNCLLNTDPYEWRYDFL